MDEPIRVAQVMGKMENGGVESVIMNYYKHIDRDKVQFDFIVDDDSSVPQKKEIESMGGRVYMVPPYQHIASYLFCLTKIFKENKYKIVHSNLNTLSVFPLYAAKRADVPVRIAHNHSTAGKGETKKNILKYMLRPFAKLYPTNYAACTEYAGEWLFGKRTMEHGNVTVFNNALDIDKFKFNRKTREHVRRELKLKGKFVIGHVGRFCYQKNQEYVVRTFAEIHKKKKNSVLLLIGDGDDVEDIKTLIHELRLDDCVRLLGNCSDTNRKYQAMDVLLFPSRYEGLGMVAVEAQLAAVHVIASTEVPDEVKMTEYIDMLPLSAGYQIWAEKALEYVHYPKKDVSMQIEHHGYDIDTESNKLEDFYESLNT